MNRTRIGDRQLLITKAGEDSEVKPTLLKQMKSDFDALDDNETPMKTYSSNNYRNFDRAFVN